MNRVFLGRVFFTALYTAIAVGFLTIHFTRVENFSTVVGGVTLKGRSSVGTALSTPQIRRISLKASGVELRLRRRDRAVIVTDDGIRHPLDVSGWEAGEDSIRVDLSSGAGFILQPDPHGIGLRLIPEIPATIPPVRSLELPLRLDGPAEVSPVRNRPGILVISSADSEYVAALPSDSTWDPASGRLNLVVLDKADPVLAISDRGLSGGKTAMAWLEDGPAPSAGIYERAVEQWMTAVRKGWESRLDPRSGLWLDSTSKAGWSDTLAAAVLADSAVSGNVPGRLQSVMAVADRAPTRIGWLPSPFLGNIVRQQQSYLRQVNSATARLKAGIASGNPNLGTKNGLTMLVDRENAADAAALVKISRTIADDSVGIAEAMDRLAILQEARSLGRDSGAADQAVRKRLLDEFLLPAVYWVKDGLWLVDASGSVDVNASIEAAVLMMREAQATNESAYQSVGRQMVVSALGYADEYGMIPARLLFESSGDVLREGAIAPEDIYPAIVAPPAYPRHVSLAAELGPGAWAITSAEKFTVRSTPRETTLTMDFPAGAIHHLAIKGIRPFNVLYMNGIQWNGDPNFQRYYAGWSYDEASQTIYLKLRHRLKTETIRILYYDPDPPPAGDEEETQEEESEGNPTEQSEGNGTENSTGAGEEGA